MTLDGPDTRYMMFWRGAWRPVVHMLAANNAQTFNVMQAGKAVLYVAEAFGWVAVSINPGDLIERVDRDPARREWAYID